MTRETDGARLERLAGTHAARVIGYLRRRTDADTAADVWQETLIVAWRRIDSVPASEDAALAWLITVARFVLANHARGTVRRRTATERLAQELRRSPVTPPDSRISVALDQLDAQDAELLRLIYWDDLTTEQAATVLGIRPAACRKRLQRARDALRTVLATDAGAERAQRRPCLTPARPPGSAEGAPGTQPERPLRVAMQGTR